MGEANGVNMADMNKILVTVVAGTIAVAAAVLLSKRGEAVPPSEEERQPIEIIWQ